jgi:hypothetical protein
MKKALIAKLQSGADIASTRKWFYTKHLPNHSQMSLDRIWNDVEAELEMW